MRPLCLALALLAPLGCQSAIETLRPWRHSPAYVEEFMVKLRARDFNHPHVGTTADPEGFETPFGWRLNERRVRLGSGKECYEKAVEAMRQWRMLDGVDWASVYLLAADVDAKESLEDVQAATQARCYGLAWVLNPVRVVYDQRDAALPAGRGCYSAVAFSTQRGHLLQGEERFAVEWHRGEGGAEDEGEVWFDLRSISRGSGSKPVRVVLQTVVKPLQRKFFTDQAATMVRLAAEAREGSGDNALSDMEI